MITQFVSRVLQFVYPQSCCLCGTNAVTKYPAVCEECSGALVQAPKSACYSCGVEVTLSNYGRHIDEATSLNWPATKKRVTPAPNYGQALQMVREWRSLGDVAPSLRALGGYQNLQGSSKPKICQDCVKHKPVFAQLIYPFSYEGLTRKLISKFKYQDSPELASFLVQALAYVAAANLPELNFVCVPIPTTSWRLLRRKFHQTELLSAGVAQMLNLRMDSKMLQKKAYSKAQASLDLEGRIKNVKGSFIVRSQSPKKARLGGSSVVPNISGSSDEQTKISTNGLGSDSLCGEGQHVLLVEDIVTTGSTIREAAEALLRAGVASVRVLCFARVPGRLRIWH